jgi:hypothetical protein
MPENRGFFEKSTRVSAMDWHGLGGPCSHRRLGVLAGGFPTEREAFAAAYAALMEE